MLARVLSWLALLARSSAATDAEITVPRHEVAVLRRHNTGVTLRGTLRRKARTVWAGSGDGWRGVVGSVGVVALAVCLLFDRRSERAVRALWDRLERAGVPSLRSHTHGRHLPHVSYAVLRTWDLVAVSAAVAGLGAVAPVELTFDGVGLFRRGRAWLLAGANAEFLTWQERVVDVVTATGAELHKHYRPGRWVPHCSVAPRAPLAQLPVLVSALYEVLPLETRLDRVALIDSATGEFWPVQASP